jgi:hypothetical protein
MKIEVTIRRFTLLVVPEAYRWAEYADGQYGMAVTYWRRSKWQWGVRFSLLWGHSRPFARVTTYSCPTVGTAGVVKPLDCVRPHAGWSKYSKRRAT